MKIVQAPLSIRDNSFIRQQIFAKVNEFSSSASGEIVTRSMRFLVAGALSTGVNWFARLQLSAVLPLTSALVLAYMIGMIVGFWSYRKWVFPRSSLSLRSEILRFLLVNCIGLAVVWAATTGLVALLTMHGHVLSNLEIGGCHAVALVAAAGVNFLGHNFVTFARARSARVWSGR